MPIINSTQKASGDMVNIDLVNFWESTGTNEITFYYNNGDVVVWKFFTTLARDNALTAIKTNYQVDVT